MSNNNSPNGHQHAVEPAETQEPRPSQSVDAALESLIEPDDSPAASLSPLAEEALIESLRSQLTDAENRALRYQADLENFRRRARREADEQLKFANWGLITDLLETLDNLERALDSAPCTSQSDNVLTGVHMVVGQMKDVLQKYGCVRIEAVGEAFDPNLHQAVQMIESTDSPPNQIVQELRAGYKLHDRVLRPSQVVVVGPSARV